MFNVGGAPLCQRILLYTELHTTLSLCHFPPCRCYLSSLEKLNGAKLTARPHVSPGCLEVMKWQWEEREDWEKKSGKCGIWVGYMNRNQQQNLRVDPSVMVENPETIQQQMAGRYQVKRVKNNIKPTQEFPGTPRLHLYYRLFSNRVAIWKSNVMPPRPSGIRAGMGRGTFELSSITLNLNLCGICWSNYTSTRAVLY